jgi:uncharacterized membrane protein
LRRHLYAVAFSILLVGLTAGAVIYVMADDSADAMQEIYGSKTYTRQLQRFGGKASVMFDDFNRWFASLWSGKTLGATIACLTVAVAGGVFLVARRYRD